MGRNAKGWWDERRRRWLVRLGPKSPTTGKPTPVPLLGEDGVPIGREDLVGRDAAIARLRGEPTDADRGPTVAEVCRLYVAWHKDQGSAPRTIREHWKCLRRFAEFRHEGVRYGERPAASIVPKDLARLKSAGVKRLRHVYMSVLACWRWAARPIEDREPERLIPSDPLAGMIRPRGGQRPSEATPWPVARRILRMARAWAREPHRPYVRTRACRRAKAWALMAMAYSGGRTAEIVLLEWDDIRWSESVAVIPAVRLKTRRTGKVRYVPLLPRLVRLLRVIERWPHRHERYVFGTRYYPTVSLKTWWNSIRRDLLPYLAARGLELPEGWRAYWLRHSFATEASRAVGAEEASKALGHSPDVLRGTYDHVEAGRVRRIGEAVEKARRSDRARPDDAR